MKHSYRMINNKNVHIDNKKVSFKVWTLLSFIVSLEVKIAGVHECIIAYQT